MRADLGFPLLKLIQVQSHLDANHRSAGSLLAAFQATGDRALLQEAQEKYPQDPQVNVAAYYRGPFDSTQPASPERRGWLESLKASDPESPLANYLAARDDFKAGQTDRAIEELLAASGKRQLRDYSADSIQNVEEVWRAAGYSAAEAAAVASATLRMNEVVDLKQLAGNLVAAANAYQLAGNAKSAETVLRIGIALGQQLDQASPAGLSRNLAGLRIESEVLRAMEQTAAYDANGRTVAERLAEIASRREALMALGEQFQTAWPKMTEADLVSFYERQKTFGAESALRWLASRLGEGGTTAGGGGH